MVFINLEKVLFLKLKEIDYKNTFSKRTIKSRNEFEENIIIDEVNFTCYTNCIWCGQAIDTGRICSDLAKMHTRKKNQMDEFKCPHKTRDGDICDYFTFLKIKFKYGVNLYNPKISKYNTSKYFSLPLLSISTLTSFAVVLQLFVNRFSVLNSYPPNVPQQEYQQVIYQQPQYQPGYMPNVQPSNYQPGYIPTASPNYQPPQYQPGNQFNAPPINNQQPQYKPGYEPTSQPSDNLQPQNQPGYEPIAPSSNDQSLSQPGNEPNAPPS